MVITIMQDERGCDVVKINGEVASKVVTDAVLCAVEVVERIQLSEANSHFTVQ